jgi:hypothetical protein
VLEPLCQEEQAKRDKLIADVKAIETEEIDINQKPRRLMVRIHL